MLKQLVNKNQLATNVNCSHPVCLLQSGFVSGSQLAEEL
jgi:hypothetical protein